LTELVKYEAAERAIAEAEAVDEVLEIRSQAEACGPMPQAKNKDLEIKAARIRFRAERRLGEMLIEAKEAGQISRGQPQNRPKRILGNGRILRRGRRSAASPSARPESTASCRRGRSAWRRWMPPNSSRRSSATPRKCASGQGRVAMDLLKVVAED
jgi:hypothetical protein